MQFSAVASGSGQHGEPLDKAARDRLSQVHASLTANMIIRDSCEMVPVSGSQYMALDEDCNECIQQSAWLNMLSHTDYEVAWSAISKGKARLFKDLGLLLMDGTVTKRFEADSVVLGGMESSALMRVRKPKWPGERQMGSGYCRLGLPIQHFLKILLSVRSQRPAVKQSLLDGSSHLWIKACWGVSGKPCRFIWEGQKWFGDTTDQQLVHGIFGNKSIIGRATLEISVSSQWQLQGHLEIEDIHTSEFVFKLFEFEGL